MLVVFAPADEKLTSRGLRVWWDAKCLKPGQPWEDGFADGLFASRVFVPVLSKGALANYAKLETDSKCDNVLLEHLLGLEQYKREELKAIFPVFVGHGYSSGAYGHFFRDGAMPTCPDVIVEAVEAKLHEHLGRQHKKSSTSDDLRVDDCTPGGVLEQILKHQGGFVEGMGDKALERIADTICAMVKDVAAGKVIAEAPDARLSGRQSGKQSGKQSEGDGDSDESRWSVGSNLVAGIRRLRMGRAEMLTKPLRTSMESSETAPDDMESQQPSGWRRSARRCKVSFSDEPEEVDGSLILKEFFSSASLEDESTAGELPNPVLVRKAEKDRTYRKRPKKAAAPKTGGLKRLLPSAQRQDMTSNEEIEQYLKRQGIRSDDVRLGKDSLMSLELQKANFTRRMQQRLHDRDVAQRARVRRAPNQPETHEEEEQGSAMLPIATISAVATRLFAWANKAKTAQVGPQLYTERI